MTRRSPETAAASVRRRRARALLPIAREFGRVAMDFTGSRRDRLELGCGTVMPTLVWRSSDMVPNGFFAPVSTTRYPAAKPRCVAR